MQQNIDRSVQKDVTQQTRGLPQRPASETHLLIVLLIVVCTATVVVHSPALSTQAEFLDDYQYLTDNPLVQNPGWTSTRRFLTEVLEPSTVRGYYQPLAMISLMLDYTLGGRPDNLKPFRRTSLMLHAANTALVIVLLYLLFGRAPIAAAVGLLFGLHPITVEPICWMSERKTLLTAFFALWCLILYVRYTRSSSWRVYAGCMLMYVLALMSKPTSLPLPVLMVLMDYWPLRRLNRRAITEKLPFFVMMGIFAVITYISQSRTATVALPDTYNLNRIILTLCHNIIFYPCKIIWPANLSPYYTAPSPLALSEPMVLASVVGTCILLVALVISLRWTPAALTSWLFFLVAIFPTMGVVGFTNAIASDRFAYLPSVGLLMMLAAFLGWLCNTRIAGNLAARYIIMVIAVLVLTGGEAVATRQYLARWRDTTGLHEYILKMTPDAAPVHNSLGSALQAQGRLDEAISHYRQALKLEPGYADAHNNLGTALQVQDKLDLAIQHYRQALQLKPNIYQVHSNLGYALARQGRLDQAITHYTEALRINPGFASAHNDLAVLLTRQGKLDEAVTHLTEALQINPNFAEAHSNLGTILATSGQADAALEHLQEALRLKPDYPTALNQTAQILTTHPDPNLRDTSKAIQLAERAAELTSYQNTTILDTLASAYAAAGRFDQAVTTAQKALALASAEQNKELSDYFRKQLESYRQTKNYHKPIQDQVTIRP